MSMLSHDHNVAINLNNGNTSCLTIPGDFPCTAHWGTCKEVVLLARISPHLWRAASPCSPCPMSDADPPVAARHGDMPTHTRAGNTHNCDFLCHEGRRLGLGTVRSIDRMCATPWAQGTWSPGPPTHLHCDVRTLALAASCGCSGYGGIQPFLPAAHHVASSTAWYGPASTPTPQDPREGPSLARRTTPRPPKKAAS